MTVSTFSYDLTSIAYINEEKITEVMEEQPDLILFEPFTLKDNGKVGIDDSLDRILRDCKRQRKPATNRSDPAAATSFVQRQLLS